MHAKSFRLIIFIKEKGNLINCPRLEKEMKKKSHTLMKLILASMLLSMACSVTLKWFRTACTGGDMKVYARIASTDTTGTEVCVTATDYAELEKPKFKSKHHWQALPVLFVLIAHILYTQLLKDVVFI